MPPAEKQNRLSGTGSISGKESAARFPWSVLDKRSSFLTKPMLLGK